MKRSLLLFLATATIYGLTSYGGVRSPDGEVVYETCEALADRGTFAIENVSSWPGFGVATGLDGKSYSVFGVGQSLACVPILKLGRWFGIAGDAAPRSIQPSFYVPGGYAAFAAKLPAEPHAPHGDRFAASFLDVIVGAFGAVVFFWIARRFTRNERAAFGVTLLYAFGTPLWSYSGFCFSEPLAILCALLSLLALLRAVEFDRRDGAELRTRLSRPARHGFLALAGLALGAAVATHITAILFAPFFLAIPLLLSPRDERRRDLLPLGAALALSLAALGWYNQIRFGSWIETGRSVDPSLAARFGYGHFSEPLTALFGFAFGGGKSLLLFAPAAVVGALLWKRFMQVLPQLAALLGCACLLRVLFIAGRSDWHGGFCLGPRLLLMLIPILLLPIALWLDDAIAAGRRGALLLFAILTTLAVSEQWLFVIGEPFSFYRRLVESSVPRGIDLFSGDRLYLDWGNSPIPALLGGPRGPWLLRDFPLSNTALWIIGSGLIAGLVFWFVTRVALHRRDGMV